MQIQYRGRTLQGRHKRIGHVSQSQVFVFEHDAFTLDGLLPRGITRRIAPSWDLPRKLVVKHYCNEDEKDRDLQAAYSTEVAAYRQMAPIQGCTVPRFYGPVVVDGGDCPAIAVEFLDGVTVWDLCVPGCPAATYCDPDAVSSGITQCFSDISSCGVVQSDCEFDKLDSLMYVGQPKRYLLPAVVAMLTTAIWLPLWLTTMLCVVRLPSA